jgi:serine/threonine protein kinase
MTHIHDKTLPTGTQIGVYEIKDAAKIGTFGITYRAWNHHLKERVKIHEYFPRDFAIRASDGLSVEPKSADDRENFDYGLKKFLDQGEILTQIEHSNIAAAENVLQLNGTVYLITGVSKGVSLSRLIQHPTTFAETELKFILVSILTALQKIHEHKIVHGGIQPATIILSKNGEPMLIDFAAARLAIAARTPQLADELAAGYAPAEQYEPTTEPGPATDFYALGATMYYCMTHQQPVVAQSRMMLLSTGAADPMILRPGLTDVSHSTELLQAIHWMLQPEYSQRPQSANELLTLLESKQSDDRAKSLISGQATADVTQRKKNAIRIGVMAGIAVLVAIGLWFDQKSDETLAGKPDRGIIPSVPENNSKETTTASATTKVQPAATIAVESDQVSDIEEITSINPETTNETERQSTEEPVTASPLAVASEREASQRSAVVDHSLSQPMQSSLQEKAIDAGLKRKYLAAAAKAMKAGHLTTPLKDNAHKYYRAVLAAEPDNSEALAGLRKIVDRYIQFISTAKAKSNLSDAKLYLQRAESVLPDDPKLQSIRAELAAK